MCGWRARESRQNPKRPRRPALFFALPSAGVVGSPDYRGRNEMIRKAKAVWRGNGRDGRGAVSTESGVLSETPYSFRTRFESEKGTNPEELIAAAHAGCFSMAMAFALQGAGYTPTELDVDAAVTLEPDGQGFRISRSALTLQARAPGLDQATFAQIVSGAEKNCPVSKVLNAAITVEAKLIAT
jgi:osmotically inducible protein OsmC